MDSISVIFFIYLFIGQDNTRFPIRMDFRMFFVDNWDLPCWRKKTEKSVHPKRSKLKTSCSILFVEFSRTIRKVQFTNSEKIITLLFFETYTLYPLHKDSSFKNKI